MDEKLLDIQDLSVWYKTYRGFAEVVDHINLYVGKGEKIGLVGESGCGKTTTMKMVMRTLDERGIKVGGGLSSCLAVRISWPWMRRRFWIYGAARSP